MPDPTPEPQHRPPRYLDAVAFARGRARVRLGELAEVLAVDAETADAFLSCLQAEGVIGPRTLSGWWPVLPAPEPAAPATLAVAALEAAVERLQRAVEAARQRAEAAQRRALVAERRVTELESRPRTLTAGDERLTTLKRLLARELHPDQPGSPAERSLREALFKRLWPKLEAL
ncbi:hypothetical protein ACFQU2_03265 [Siccirubricoccus deserti]